VAESVLQKTSHPTICRGHLLFAILAYRLQADRFGDLDHETRQLLDRAGAKEIRRGNVGAGSSASTRSGPN